MENTHVHTSPNDQRIITVEGGGHRYIYVFTNAMRERLCDTVVEQHGAGEIPIGVARTIVAFIHREIHNLAKSKRSI